MEPQNNLLPTWESAGKGGRLTVFWIWPHFILICSGSWSFQSLPIVCVISAKHAEKFLRSRPYDIARLIYPLAFTSPSHWGRGLVLLICHVTFFSSSSAIIFFFLLMVHLNWGLLPKHFQPIMKINRFLHVHSMNFEDIFVYFTQF